MNNHLPYLKHEEAKGRLAAANAMLRSRAYEMVEAGHTPKKVLIGSYWLQEYFDIVGAGVGLKSCWFGDFGIECEIEVIEKGICLIIL